MNKTAILACVLLASSGFSMADSDHPHDVPSHHKPYQKHDGLPHDLAKLNLTDAQKKQIQTILDQNRPAKPNDHATSREAFQQKMQQRQAQELNIISSRVFNEQAARQLINERTQERAQLEQDHAERELQMLKTRHAIFQVLTPEQQQQFISNQKRHPELKDKRP